MRYIKINMIIKVKLTLINILNLFLAALVQETNDFFIIYTSLYYLHKFCYLKQIILILNIKS